MSETVPSYRERNCAETVPTPVGEHYVRGLLLLSSCFGTDQDGRPNVCATEPCACAQSLLQEISRPLKAENERLRAAQEEALEHLYDSLYPAETRCLKARAALERKNL